MYWYVKYPLLILLVCCLLGLSCLLWRSLMPTKKDQAETQQVEMPPEIEAQPTAEAQTAPPAPQPPPANSDDLRRLEEQLRQAEEQLQAGTLEGARLLASLALKMESCVEFDKNWFRAMELINTVNRRFMNSSAPCPEKKRHTVQSGDTLGRIAAKYYTTVDALVRMNNLNTDTGTIHPHQVISWLDGSWSIRVSKHNYILILYFNGKPFRLYHVAIGKEDRTPVGTFLISSRIKHPAWTPPGKNIPYGDPENLLGSHWLGLTPTGNTDPTLSGYGIHGTWEPDSIGKAASSGCVRLLNEEVEELFDFIPEPGGICPPVPVTIEE